MSYNPNLKVTDKSWGKGGYLGRAKMRRMLFVSMLSAIQGIIMEATDRIILGNMVGPEAVSGAVLVSPIFEFGTIFEVLVASGASILYARAIGNYDKDKSRRILGMTSVIALIFGAFMSILSFAGENLFLTASNAHGLVLEYGRQYFYFYRFMFIIEPLRTLLTELLYIDGDDVRVFLSEFSLLVGNAAVSFLLIPHMGVMGASLGSAIGTTMSFLIILSHFFAKKYRIIPIIAFDKKDLKEILIIGGTDAVNCGMDSVYSFLLNLFVIRMFGDEYLAIIAVTSVVYTMMEVGAGVADAMKTMLMSYRGDNNFNAMKGLVLYGVNITFIISVVFIGFVWITAPLYPHIYGIDGTDLQSLTILACRITALSSLAVILYGVFLEYYIDIGKYGLQILGNALDSLFVRILLNVSLGLAFGAIGLWIGEALCTYVCLAIMIVVIYRIYGKERFPFLLENNSNNSMNISYTADIEDIMTVRDNVEGFLKERTTPKSAINLAMLFFEDISLLIRDSNPDKKHIHIDAFVTSGIEELHVVMWYDGELLDLSDSDLVPSDIRAYMISSLVSGYSDSKYQETAGYNRVSFVIPYRKLAKNRNAQQFA